MCSVILPHKGKEQLVQQLVQQQGFLLDVGLVVGCFSVTKYIKVTAAWLATQNQNTVIV